MKLTENELLNQLEELSKTKVFSDIDILLTDQLLEEYNSAPLYAFKARAKARNGEIEQCLQYVYKALSIDPSSPMAYLARGNAMYFQNDFNKALADYTTAIQLDISYPGAYYNRAIVYSKLEMFDKAFEDYDYAIKSDPKNSSIYYNRGLAWSKLKQYKKSLTDYSKAINLDKKYQQAYNNRAIIYSNLKEYDKAIKDLNKAIEIDKNYKIAYSNRGKVFVKLGEYQKALKDFNQAINLDLKYRSAYYNRAGVYKHLGKKAEALNDYKHYLNFNTIEGGFFAKSALAEIKDLEEKIANSWYEEIGNLINKIKSLLLFNKECITHYTSLSAAKAMILESSVFRLSEGAFLNDTSEGRELFKYLSFDNIVINKDETVAEAFIERPFIGSFVADSKHDDLTLWRMYGKESDTEAKGCALTIHREKFINSLNSVINPKDDGSEVSFQNEEKFVFYKVAYKTKERFFIPEENNKNNKALNDLVKLLKEKVNGLNSNQKVVVTKMLNDIAYLFKSAEYQYEQEVRLVVQGVGFKKKIEKESIPPKVYIELVELVPVLSKITLGPKVEKANEWAASFNYFIKDKRNTYSFSEVEDKVNIIISNLPFK